MDGPIIVAIKLIAYLFLFVLILDSMMDEIIGIIDRSFQSEQSNSIEIRDLIVFNFGSSPKKELPIIALIKNNRKTCALMMTIYIALFSEALMVSLSN